MVYCIYDENSTLLYTGKAVAKPNGGGCQINVSEIVRNYLNCDLPDVAFNGEDFNTGQIILPNATLGFTLTDEKGTVLEEYKFLNCWDYKTPFSFFATSSMNYPLSNPANDHRTTGMYWFSSVYEKVQRKVRTTISSFTGDTCGYGALYYANAMGGWDAFLIEGMITKKDSYQRYTIENKWMSGTLESGSRTLVNTVDESWELKTHLLKDSESKILSSNLFNSNNIYFHSFADDKIYPVSITDTSVTYKDWRNQKKKKFYVTINIKSNQPKQRI
jgi:hypothetical protein